MTPEEDLDHASLYFGKYVGKTPDEVSCFDPDYVIWLYERCTPRPVSRALYEACRQDEDDDSDSVWEAPHF